MTVSSVVVDEQLLLPNISSDEALAPTAARRSFDESAEDVRRLMDLHEKEGGKRQGRRRGLEVLNKSAVVLLTALWEAYCEDVAQEAIEKLVDSLNDPARLPIALRKVVARELKSDKDELAIWGLAEAGWKTHIRKRYEDMREVRNRKLNTPKAEQIRVFFLDSIGLEDVTKSWKWKGVSAVKASERLDRYVTLRGAIAHRGRDASSVHKSTVMSYFTFIQLLISATDDAVNQHVRTSILEG